MAFALRTPHGKHGMSELLYEDEVFRIRGAIFEVYKELGNGFLEAVYQECLEHEFHDRGIPFRARSALNLTYKSHSLSQIYRPDFICFDKIIIEIKVTPASAPEHKAQLLNCLKATGLRLGLLVNFGVATSVKIERFIL